MKIFKLNSISQFLIYACVMSVATTTTALFADEIALSNIKKEITELQEILLNPKKSQLAILISVKAKSDFKINSVSFYIDSKKTKTYIYTERESNALLNNSTHKIYVGEINEGVHTIKAQLTAIGGKKKDYNISSSSKFTKSNTAKYVELKISKSEQQDLPALNIKIWE